MAALAVLTLGLALAGCAAPATGDDPAVSGPVDDAAPDGVDAGAPAECADAFPQAIGAPDLADVAALPADWPEPPAGSTLCLTASAFGDGGTESLSYVTAVEPEAVLAHYEALLTGYELAREPGPTGVDMLVGDGASIAFQLRADEGTIVIALAPTQ